MVNFIDLIKDFKGKRALDASNQADLDAYNKLLAGEDVEEVKQQPKQQAAKMPETLIMDASGNIDYPASVRLKQQTTPLSLADRLIGREVHIDKETIDPKTNEMTTQRFSDYKPGFLNDFSAGYKENAATPISFNNFGQNKNLATRLGEGFGTAARLLDNPLMRGAIAYGLSNSMGDRRPLVQALNATVGTQQNISKDRLYRQELEKQGVDTSQIRGFITDDTFKNYSLANYRNRNLDIKYQLGMLKNNTDRAKLVNVMLNSGVLSPAEAVQQMGEYGININELDESNQTKLLPYKQYALKNGWDLGWVNFKLKQDAQNIKNDIIKDLMGGGTSGNKSETVRVKRPDGKVGTIPIDKLDAALANGYKRI